MKIEIGLSLPQITAISRIGKAVVSGLLITASAAGFISCGSKKMDSKEVAEKHNEAKFDKADEKDAQFLVDAAEMNLKEIQLGQLAQEKGFIEDVRDLGKSMEVEHVSVQSALTKLAAKKTISIPTVLTQAGQDAFRKLHDKSGKSFDKEYCSLTVKTHERAIDSFEVVANTGKDPEIREWAKSMLSALRNHLDHALICQAICAKQS